VAIVAFALAFYEIFFLLLMRRPRNSRDQIKGLVANDDQKLEKIIEQTKTSS
jgi:hypothetical protein